MKKDKVVIIGSTGSIGTQTIDVIETVGDKEIVALACKSNIKKLYEQVKKLKVKLVAIYDEDKANEFRDICRKNKVRVKVLSKMDGLITLSTYKSATMVMVSVVGMIGIVHPQVMANTVGFEINLSQLDFQNVAKEHAPILSKFPKTELDFTFVWKDCYAKLENIWTGYHNPLVTRRYLKAVYGNKFTLTFTVSSTEKTLDKAEINKIHQEILDFAARNNVQLG